MNTLAFPLRFSNNSLVSLIEGTDAYYNQLISIAVQVAPGEMPLDIDFGIRDMTFGDLSNSSLKQALSFYFPDISIDEVTVVKNVKTSDFVIDLSYSY